MDATDLVDALSASRAAARWSTRRSSRSSLARVASRDPLEALTPREREVLALMAEGRSNNGIALRLTVTEGAVEKHVRSIMAKLRLPADGRRPPARARGADVPRHRLRPEPRLRRAVDRPARAG